MKHYDYLAIYEEESIFYLSPSNIKRDDDKEIIAHSLGSLLYMPAIRLSIAEEIIGKKYAGLKSVALCLEDAIGDNKVEEAEKSIIKIFKRIKKGIDSDKIYYEDIPFIFIRVREANQINEIAEQLGENIDLLTGFIFPKFSSENGNEFFEKLIEINKKLKQKIYGMPIFESPKIIYKESRMEELNKIVKILDNYSEYVLNIRIGVTDFSNLFGIRRGYDINIYNINVLSDCISDIVNVFSRCDRSYVISGPVWEYFVGGERIIKPQIRQTPFQESHGKYGYSMRKKIIHEYIDGLIYEVVLDKANGLCGKTIIHPSHIIPVQSLYAVTHEEYLDAVSIVENNTGDIGVLKSNYSNKMNEIKTHLNWAKKIILRSKIYGVLNEGKVFTDLFPKNENL